MPNDNVKLKILVTGAKGQLGKKIIEATSDKYELILTDAAEMDITDAAKTRKVIDREKPDFIIHGAAYTQVDKAEENIDLCRKVNAYGTENIAKAAKANNATVIYISTDYVFDGKKKTPYIETDEPHPLSVYGRTKYEGELAVQKVYEGTVPMGGQSPCGYYIIRSAWIFGELPEGYPGTNFVETMLKLAKEREELNIVDDQVGSPTYTGDLVDCIEELVTSNDYGNEARIVKGLRQTLPKTDKGPDMSRTSIVTDKRLAIPCGIYHFSGTGACSWHDFAKEIFRQSNIKINLKPITSKEYPQKAERPAYSYLGKGKIEAALGIKVRSWREMLGEYLEKRR